MRMGAGVAKLIKEKCKWDTKKFVNQAEVGEILPKRVGHDYILQQVTKEKSHKLPFWEDLKNAVNKLPKECERLGINKLAMPQIGCGLDAFEWSDVSTLLNKVFQNTDIEVSIYLSTKEEPNFKRIDGRRKWRNREERRTKTYILGDSQARGIGTVLEEYDEVNRECLTWAQSGATTKQLARQVNNVASHLFPTDNLIVITGTNDITFKERNAAMNLYRKERKCILSQAKRTKVKIMSIPYSYDKEGANEYIKAFNQQLYQLCWEEATNMGIERNARRELKQHLVTHTGQREFQCTECGRKFGQVAHLSQHLMTHTGDKPHECDVCGKRFGRKSDLDRHDRVHTAEKPFGCSECPKRFSESSSLIRHLRTHTGAKPFGCSECGKKFSQSGTLRMHLRTHTGDKPFACSECDQKFSQSGTLRMHLRTHTGDRPFACSECDKKFSVACSLRKLVHQHLQ